MGKEWECRCKDCNSSFTYSNTKYEAGAARGMSRPERCDNCRAQHAREIQSLGQAYYKVKALKPICNPKRLTSDLGRFDREDRPHSAVVTTPPPIDPNKFGIKDDRLIELFHFFKQDPGLQVVVVVGPTGSGKSTYLPYRLVEIPTRYQDAHGNQRKEYWTVPIESEEDLQAAQAAVKHTILTKGVYRHYTSPPDDPRAKCYPVADLDPKMFHRYGQIVVTQPRIQATRNIPEFIANAMMGCQLGAGHDVGFRHSGSPNSDWSTKLAFVTDGTLITWISKGELDKINTIMIDEAHERSLNIDIIIGMLTRLLPRYPRLRLIIASATIAADKFINHFNKYLPQRLDAAGNILPNCRFMEFEGKSFKVSPHFRRQNEPVLDYYRETLPSSPDGQVRWEGRYREPKEIYREVAEKAVEILKEMYDTSPDGGYLEDQNGSLIDITERQGDILGFLHGEAPIQNGCKLVESLAKQTLGDRVKVRSLPLYTTLKQSEQDEALKERVQPHTVLFKKIVELLEQIVQGEEPSGDVLAILNNAGQIHNLCADLEKRVRMPTLKVNQNKQEKEIPNLLLDWAGRIHFAPWFTPGTARQLFETMPERCDLQIAPPTPGHIVVVISTTRHRPQLGGRHFEHKIELPLEERRVVISTNVAETSLTIHGILHVVDSGLINQNKWDAETQTSSVTAILQSRAGCKQRWGRAGRLQAGDAWLLYTEKQFGKEQGEDDNNPDRCFAFYSLPEISRSPLEQVLLTAKKSGAESLNPIDFPWLDAPDAMELSRAERSLSLKGALDQDGDLTEHGVELGNMRSDARVGNMLIVADRFSCALEMITVVAVAEQGLRKLLAFDRQWDEATTKEVQQRQSMLLSGCQDDLDAALKLIACWEEVHQALQSFVQYVRLIVDGDALTQEYQITPAGKRKEGIRSAIEKLQNTLDEKETHLISQELFESIKNRTRRNELQKAIGASLKIRSTYQRLSPVWNAVLNSWSFSRVWDEACAAPVVGEVMLREKLPPVEFDRGVEVISQFFPLIRESIRRGPREVDNCCAELSRRLGDLSRNEDSHVELLCSLAQIANPEFAQAPRRIAHDLMRLNKSDGQFYSLALKRLPDAAARAWARSNYLNPDAFTTVLETRTELLEPLEAHKKGAEFRPLDLSRNDRLRVLFATSLPDNAYSCDNGGAYRAVIDDEDGKVGTSRLQVEIADDSVCSLDNPKLFVCLERQAAPYVEGKDRKIFASFIVNLPPAWEAAMRDPKQPLHHMSTPKLGRFIADSCQKDELLGRDLLLDQLFPRGAICSVKVAAVSESAWLDVEVAPPKLWPKPVTIRYKRAADEEVRSEPDIEETIIAQRHTPSDLGLTKTLRKLQAGEAVEESSGQIDPFQWEKLFLASASRDLIEELPSGKKSAGEVYLSQLQTQFSWTFDAVPGKLAAEGNLPKGRFDAEVVQLVRAEDGVMVPCLKFPVSTTQFESFSKTISAADIGKEFTLKVDRLERLLLGEGSLLVARELTTGIEVNFGPRDLSFSGCGSVPELIFRYLAPGKTFVARLVQIDPDSCRLRMTTHHIMPQLFPNPIEVIGKSRVEVLQHSNFGPYVRLLRDEPPELSGFALIAKLDENQLTSEAIGRQHIVHLLLPSRTRESWPKDVAVPQDLADDGSMPEAIFYKGQVSLDQLSRWMGEIRDHRLARAAIYSLFERTYQLSGMDEKTYREWESCINRPLIGRVVRHGSHGIAFEVKEMRHVPLWMPREEYSWYYDEFPDDVVVGQELKFTGLEVDLIKRQVYVSVRQLTPNPYLSLREGQPVICQIVKVTPSGAEIRIKRLRGWIRTENLVSLPQERLQLIEGSKFRANIVRVDTEQGKITVSRWPVVQECLRSMVAGNHLWGKVTEIVNNGVRVELAPGLLAWLPGEEVSWTRGRTDLNKELQIGEVLRVVLLPKRADARADDLRVSRKRITSREYIVRGKPGLFFAGRPYNVKTIIDGYHQSGKSDVNVDTIERGATGTRILIRANSMEDLKSVTKSLTAMAYMNSCTLSLLTQEPGDPVFVSNLTLPEPSKGKPDAAKIQPVVEQRGFFTAIKGFFRWLFGMK